MVASDTPDGFTSTASADGEPRQDQTHFGGSADSHPVALFGWTDCGRDGPRPPRRLRGKPEALQPANRFGKIRTCRDASPPSAKPPNGSSCAGRCSFVASPKAPL